MARADGQELGPARSAVLLADRREGPDLWGVAEAMQPLADLCLSERGGDPVRARPGRRPRRRQEFRAAPADRGGGERARGAAPAPLLAKSSSPKSTPPATPAIPPAPSRPPAYAALERDYAALAEEASHAARRPPPRRRRRRRAPRRDRRAGWSRSGAPATRPRRAGRGSPKRCCSTPPGSRIDAFIRASRGAIESTAAPLRLCRGRRGRQLPQSRARSRRAARALAPRPVPALVCRPIAARRG